MISLESVNRSCWTVASAFRGGDEQKKKSLILVSDLPHAIIRLGEVGSKQCKYLDQVAGLHVKKVGSGSNANETLRDSFRSP